MTDDLSQYSTDQLHSMLAASQPDLSSIPTDKLVAMLQTHPALHTPDPTASNAPGMSATSGNSFLDNLYPGIGQGMSGAVTGAAQLAAHIPGVQLAANLTGGNPDVAGSIDKTVKEKDKIDTALLKTGGGVTGSVLGNLYATAPIMGIEGPVGATSTLGKIAQAAMPAAMQGGAAGLIQPSTGDNFAQDKAKQIAAGAAAGAGTSLVGQGLGKILSNLNPVAAAFNGTAGGDLNSQFAKEGEKLAQDGYQLTPAQITGSKSQAKLENFTRQSLFGADAAHAVDDSAAKALVGKIQETIDGIGNSGESGDIGQRIQGVVKNALSDLTDKRATQAATDFGAVRAMTKGAATIEPSDTNALLQQVLQENQGAGTDSGDKLARWAKTQLSNVAPNTQSGLNDIDKAAISQFGGVDNMTPDALATAEKWSPGITERMQGTNQTAPAQGNLDKLIMLRSEMSKVAGGIKGIGGDRYDQVIGAKMMGTIDSDIDRAGDQIGGDVGGALKTAISNYKEGSRQIEGVQQSGLGHLLGEDLTSNFSKDGTFNTIPGEVVAARLQNLQPSQIQMAKSLLQKYSPQTWQDTKATVLQNALDKAQASAPSAGAKTLAANSGTYVNSLLGQGQKNAGKLAAIFEPGEMDDINRTIAASRRLADRTGSNPSGTTPMAEIGALLHALPRAFVGDPTAMGQIAAQVAAPKAMARVMANPEGRAAVRQFSILPPGSSQARQVASQLAAIAGAQSVNGPSQ
jgi:hypothetical protein